MQTATFLIGFLIILNLATIYIISKRKEKREDGEGLKLLLTQLNELSRTVDAKMGETSKMMHESVRSQFSESAKLIKEVTEGLTKLDETNRQVVSFADQLRLREG